MLESLSFLHEVPLARVIATQAVASQGYPLAGAGTVSHVARSIAGHGAIQGVVFTDADGTLFIEQSLDGANWDISEQVQVFANIPAPFDFEAYGVMARARYVNGAVPQTVFRSNVVAKPLSGAPGGSAEGDPDLTGLVIADTIALLGGAATFTGPTVTLSPVGAGQKYQGYDIVRGFAFSDVGGTVRVIQGRIAADVTADTNVSRVDFAVPAGGNGLQFNNILVAPVIAVRYINGGAAQAFMRFFASVNS